MFKPLWAPSMKRTLQKCSNGRMLANHSWILIGRKCTLMGQKFRYELQGTFLFDQRIFGGTM